MSIGLGYLNGVTNSNPTMNGWTTGSLLRRGPTRDVLHQVAANRPVIPQPVARPGPGSPKTSLPPAVSYGPPEGFIPGSTAAGAYDLTPGSPVHNLLMHILGNVQSNVTPAGMGTPGRATVQRNPAARAIPPVVQPGVNPAVATAVPTVPSGIPTLQPQSGWVTGRVGRTLGQIQ